MTVLSPIAWFEKDPDAVLDYTIDWSDVISSDDTITLSNWVITGLTIESDSFTASTTTAFISGGTAGTVYFVLNHIETAGGRKDDRVLQIAVGDYRLVHALLKDLRLALGDIDATSYRYLDKWLIASLLASTKSLQPWWDWKYLVNESTEDIYRNPNYNFLYDTPILEQHDERAIILMACIIIKTGQLENLSWSVGSWRDNEITYSNIESSRNKSNSIERDWKELLSIVKPPQKKLALAKKGHLPGFINTVEQ